MNQLIRLFFLTFLAVILLYCENFPQEPESKLVKIRESVDSIRLAWVPDKRVAVFTPVLKRTEGEECLRLTGYSQLPGASEAVRTLLSERGFCFRDSLISLPTRALGADTFGIVRVSVANLRSEARHSAELATQTLLGMPLRVLEQRESWWRVQTPEGYVAWLDGGAFERLDATTFHAYYRGELALVEVPLVQLTTEPGRGEVLRDLSLGNLVKVGPEISGYRAVTLPDGQTGFLPDEQLLPYSTWTDRSVQLDLPRYAVRFYGAPYLWGGTSAKGVDCSGFTKMTYWLNGFVIPRDASQQVHAGEEIPLDNDLSQLRRGDLLFFGNLREDGSQRITHVGLYLGAGRFVHSGADNGYVREQSLFPRTPDYASHRRESLLRARRLSPGSEGVVSVTALLGKEGD